MDQGNKIRFNPWATEKNFTQEIGNKPDIIRAMNESEFVIEISTENKIIPTLDSLFPPQIKGRIEVEIFARDKKKPDLCTVG